MSSELTSIWITTALEGPGVLEGHLISRLYEYYLKVLVNLSPDDSKEAAAVEARSYALDQLFTPVQRGTQPKPRGAFDELSSTARRFANRSRSIDGLFHIPRLVVWKLDLARAATLRPKVMFPCLRLRKIAERLQSIEEFERPKVQLEQYVTPAHLGSHMLHTIQLPTGRFGSIWGSARQTCCRSGLWMRRLINRSRLVG
ncbi:hypothetical protein YQE_09344, partial [Dendroctonus ponderosae]